MCRIFISHSSKDKKIANTLHDKILVLGMGFKNTDVFCTSIEGLGIKSGEDWRNEIKKHLLKAEVIILLISPNYKESEMCLNEMGAAWVTKAKVFPMVVPPVDFENIGVIYSIKQATDITNESSLDELRESLKELSAEDIPTARWNIRKKEAISEIEEYINKNPFKTPLSRDVLDKNVKDLKEANETIDELIKEKNMLEKLCKEYENCKDKEEIKSVRKSLGIDSAYEEFKKEAKNFGSMVNNFSSVLRTIIFYDFTGQDMAISDNDRRCYSSDLKEAVARKILDEDENLRNHPEIQSLRDAWCELIKQFNSLSEEDCRLMQEEYPDMPLEVDNLDFWEYVLGVRGISF